MSQEADRTPTEHESLGSNADTDMASRPTEAQSDAVLMERIKSGNKSAFGQLLNRYWEPLGRYATGVLGCEARAEDVVQEAFMQVWVRRADWEKTGTVKAYLYRMVRNFSLNQLRDAAGRERKGNQIRIQLEQGRRPPSPSETFQEQELLRRFDDVVNSMTDRRREVFTLVRFHGLSYRQVADALEIAPQTVANHMTGALADLKDALSSHLG